MAIFIGRMLAGEPVTVNGSGDQVRDFVYVGDCARANLMTLEGGSCGVYNLDLTSARRSTRSSMD